MPLDEFAHPKSPSSRKAAPPPGWREWATLSPRAPVTPYMISGVAETNRPPFDVVECQMLAGEWSQTPTTNNQIKVTGMKIFQPKRMIWS